jgi:hypothetical protein
MWLWQELTARAHGASWAGTLTALAVTALVMHLVVVHHRRQKLPPGPWPWPIVGNLFVLHGRAHRKLQKLATTYGGLMYIQLGTTHFKILVHDSKKVSLLFVGLAESSTLCLERDYGFGDGGASFFFVL